MYATAVETVEVDALAGRKLLATLPRRGPAFPNLGTAAGFVILSKSGISTVPASKITGPVGVSPISGTAITGFSLKMAANNQYSTSTQVTGQIFAANYAVPTPAKMTKAISDMETAYINAMGRTSPNFVNFAAGNLGGKKLAPGELTSQVCTLGTTTPSSIAARSWHGALCRSMALC